MTSTELNFSECRNTASGTFLFIKSTMIFFFTIIYLIFQPPVLVSVLCNKHKPRCPLRLVGQGSNSRQDNKQQQAATAAAVQRRRRQQSQSGSESADSGTVTAGASPRWSPSREQRVVVFWSFFGRKKKKKSQLQQST